MRLSGIFQMLAVLSAALFLGCAGAGDGGGATTEAGTDDGAATTTGGDCPFAAEFAGASCDPLCDQSGCAEGQICTLNGANLVCMAPGTKEYGSACSMDANYACAEGLCVIAEGESIGKCRRFCMDDSDCDDPDYACLVSYKRGADDTVSACDLKPPPCSVFEQDCEAGMGCYLSGCLEAGEGNVEDACSAPNECKPGLLCISSKCHEVCNPKTGGPDPKCKFKCPLTMASITGEDDVGVCSLSDDKPSCNLLAQNCEKEYEACYFSYDGPFCDTKGSTPVGEACVQENDCEEGSACFASSCKTICTPSAGGQGPHPECVDQYAKCPNLPGTSSGYCDE
jgi:hypothetical protein